MIATDIATMFFMSIAPRPQRQPSCTSPQNGGLDDIEMRGQHEGGLFAGPSKTRNDVGPPRGALQHHRFQAGAAQLLRDELSRFAFVSRRVGGVDPQQLLTEPKRMLNNFLVAVGHRVVMPFCCPRS